MNRVFILLAALLLSACVGGARNVPPAIVYDFGLPAARVVADGAWSRLALEVRSPSWFDSLNVDYRLAYEDPLKQREYSGSRWAGAPGLLLAQRLRQQLGTASANGNTAVDCLLRVELQEFSQIFDSPQQSRGVLQGSVSLIDAKRHLVAERQVSIEKPAATPDAHGGVKALVAASTELGLQLADWLATLEKNNALKACRSAQVVTAR
ncbi:ABC-type transport auxiliary lipoprotein family protein [Propionivibrio sp.]|uniref:ABC-type transport auxiliary lipoprotein family protein n=1 Tax=Propionivibrio sp. TaxID=2212460 RepID=UPI003BF25E94